jgi:hypothetical protein
VHQQFGEMSTDSRRRQLRLVKELSKASIQTVPGHPLPSLQPIRRGQLRQMSPALAEAYAKKTERTLTRDLNTLEKDGLIFRTEFGWYPNSDSVLAFMPPQARARDGDEFLSW